MTSSVTTEGSGLLRLPDEILVAVLKMVSPEDLSRVKSVCWRMRHLVLNYTVRLDHTAFLKDVSIHSIAGFANLILHCPRLRILSLVKSLNQESGQPVCYMDSFLKQGKDRLRFAKSLSSACPHIRVFEVCSLPSLRLVRDYVKFLKHQSVVSEIRLYSGNSRQVRSLMLVIQNFCPQLQVFKLLRREPTPDLPASERQSFSQLWQAMSPNLQGFSTNVTDRAILIPALTQLVSLRRLVVWHLTGPEIQLLTQSCTRLTSLILMSADVTGFQHLTGLPHLTDLTFCLSRDRHVELRHFVHEFELVFRVIGPQLTRLSFDFRTKSSDGCMKGLKFCTQLKHLKLRGFTDKMEVFHVVQQIPSLRSVVWKDDAAVDMPIGLNHIQQLFKHNSRFVRFVVNDIMYTRRRSPPPVTQS